jgi:transposase
MRERSCRARSAAASRIRRLGRHGRWKIERTIAWLTGYRRLTIQYERDGNHFLAFLQLAAAITCYKLFAT